MQGLRTKRVRSPVARRPTSPCAILTHDPTTSFLRPYVTFVCIFETHFISKPAINTGEVTHGALQRQWPVSALIMFYSRDEETAIREW